MMARAENVRSEMHLELRAAQEAAAGLAASSPDQRERCEAAPTASDAIARHSNVCAARASDAYIPPFPSPFPHNSRDENRPFQFVPHSSEQRRRETDAREIYKNNAVKNLLVTQLVGPTDGQTIVSERGRVSELMYANAKANAKCARRAAEGA